jgi:hypothetical protein
MTISSLSSEELVGVNGGGASCAIAGDSIAAGVAAQMPQCVHNAKVGAPSSNIIHRVPIGHFGLVVLSAGSNDPMNPHLADNLRAMRRRVHGGGVTWIEPVNAHARAVVDKVAHSYGDRVVGFTPGKDGVHPRSYSDLAHRIRHG